MIYGTPEFEKALRDLISFEPFQEDEYWMETVKHEKEMSPHLYGTKPVELLERVRPREDEAIKDYRLESYEPTTMSTAEKALTITSVIWNPRLHSIKPKDNDKGKEFYKYIMENYPKFKSIVRYMDAALTKKMMADANAWAVALPDNPLAEPSERLRPILHLYSCKRMELFDGETYLFRTRTIHEKRIVEYLWVDKNVIMKLRITLEPTVFTSDIIWAYPHNFGKFPCWIMQGTPTVSEEDENVVYYRSFMYPAVPFWNKAINAESDLDAAFINHMHPQRVEIAEDCDFMHESGVRCAGGKINIRKGAGKKTEQLTCSGCNGTGKKAVKGAHGVMYVSRDKLDPDSPQVNQAVSYVTVPHEPTQMLAERVERLLEKGLNALNMDIVNKIGENQSGIAKEYDRTELKSYLQKVSDVAYDEHLHKACYFFARYMYERDTADWEKTVMPEINKPSDFDINSLNEMIEQLKQANETGMNASYRKAKQIAIQNKEFSSYPDVQKKLNTILELDPLPQAKQEEVDLMLMSRATTTTAALIHCNLDAFVNRAIDENKGFLDMKRSQQMEILEGYAEEMDEENQVQLDLQAIEENGTGATGATGGKPNNSSGGDVRNSGGKGSGKGVAGGKQNAGEA